MSSETDSIIEELIEYVGIANGVYYAPKDRVSCVPAAQVEHWVQESFDCYGSDWKDHYFYLDSPSCGKGYTSAMFSLDNEWNDGSTIGFMRVTGLLRKTENGRRLSWNWLGKLAIRNGKPYTLHWVDDLWWLYVPVQWISDGGTTVVGIVCVPWKSVE